MRISKLAIIGFLVIDILLVFFILLNGQEIALLSPRGIIALRERDLIFKVVALMLLVAAPMYISTFIIAYKYREGNKKAKFEPDMKYGKLKMASWWVIPAIIVAIIGVIIWKDTHALDPYKPLESSTKPIRIQVVALPWKWLFIYPDYGIATINFTQFPKDTPINFNLTADNTPMSSFWIPQLSGQIYAMTGMDTKLHIMGNKLGVYKGTAAEINGKGFSGMKFNVRVSSIEEFSLWVKNVKSMSNVLDEFEYLKLTRPSENNPVSLYSSTEDDLYNKIIMKYMTPGSY